MRATLTTALKEAPARFPLRVATAIAVKEIQAYFTSPMG